MDQSEMRRMYGIMYLDRTWVASIFEGQPLKTRPFPIKARGPHLGSGR